MIQHTSTSISPYFCITPTPTIKLIQTSKRTVVHQFTKNGRTLPYLFYSNVPSAQKQMRVNGRPTPHHDTTPRRRGGNPKLLVSCITLFSVYADPLAVTHEHLQMPSMPGVRGISRRHRIFLTRRQMHAKNNKYAIARTDRVAAASSPH